MEVAMKVKDVMSAHPSTCTPDTTVAAAAALMLEADCGILPVVRDGALAGVVTDRDMYIALATRNRRASELTVGEVAAAPVYTCAPEDDTQEVLTAMREHRIRRLPVTGLGGVVLGVVSLNDLVLAPGAAKPPRAVEIVKALQGICGHGRHASPFAA
jgi:CBS domain-containing protein